MNLIAPIKVKSSKQYPVIIEDADGYWHYFDKDGKYDGYSKDCDPTIEHPELHRGDSNAGRYDCLALQEDSEQKTA